MSDYDETLQEIVNVAYPRVVAKLNTLEAERDKAIQERDAAIAERDSLANSWQALSEDHAHTTDTMNRCNAAAFTERMRAEQAESQRDAARKERDRAREALERAREQLSKHDYKGPKQIGRAMLTMDRALGIPDPEPPSDDGSTA